MMMVRLLDLIDLSFDSYIRTFVHFHALCDLFITLLPFRNLLDDAGRSHLAVHVYVLVHIQIVFLVQSFSFDFQGQVLFKAVFFIVRDLLHLVEFEALAQHLLTDVVFVLKVLDFFVTHLWVGSG